MRKPHILDQKGKTTYPKRRVYFDTESRVSIPITKEEIARTEQGKEVRKEHDLYLICASFRNGEKPRDIREYDERKFPSILGNMFWYDVDQFTNTRETTYVFAHNAKYDIQVSGGITHLIDIGYEVTSFCDESPLFIEFKKYFTHNSKGELYGEIKEEYIPKGGIVSECLIPFKLSDGCWFIPKPKSKTIMLLSSTNYYQETLKKLGATFEIEKLEYDHTEGAFDWEKAIPYCHTDVTILETAMESFYSFIQREDLGGFSITSAGQSFKAFRNRFLKHDIYIHDNAEALLTERRAYTGGRTEAFHIGKSPRHIFYVDVNSMYPAVMRNNKFPTKLVNFWRRSDLETVKEKIKEGYLICADVYINTDVNAYPYKSKKLLFPVGTYWTTLCTPELIHAIYHNHIIEIKNVCIYEADYIFTDFVQYFYRERLNAKANGDKVHDYLFKLMMNSLYGKFGQRNSKMIIVGREDKTIVETRTIYIKGEGITYQKVFGGYIWEEDKTEEANEAYNSFPAVAGHVTSYARMLLFNAMNTAGIEHVYYCDTDSIMTNEIGYKKLLKAKLINDKELGKLKLEQEGTAEWYGGKDYVFIDKDGTRTVKIKGISKNAVQLENSPEGKLRFAVSMWGGFTPRLNNGDLTKYYNRVIIKELKREYDKGIISESGRVSPHIFNEQQRIINDELTAQQLMIGKLFLVNKIRVPSTNNDLNLVYLSYSNKVKIKHFRRSKGLDINEFIKINHISLTEIITYLNSFP